MCFSIVQEVERFWWNYRHVDLTVADNGKFLQKFGNLQRAAEKELQIAKESEIKNVIDDEEKFRLFENAYNSYSELSRFLENSKDAIEFASSRSKRSHSISKWSLIVGIVGMVIGLTGILLFLLG